MGIHDRSKLKHTEIENHSTARQFSEAVSEYIEKEKNFDALLGPFASPPHKFYHCSPLLTRSKDITKIRVIVDLLSINSQIGTRIRVSHLVYNSRHWIMYYIKLYNCMTQGLLKWTFHVPDALKCVFFHEGAYYIDIQLVFGAVNGTMLFQRCSNAI